MTGNMSFPTMVVLALVAKGDMVLLGILLPLAVNSSHIMNLASVVGTTISLPESSFLVSAAKSYRNKAVTYRTNTA